MRRWIFGLLGSALLVGCQRSTPHVVTLNKDYRRASSHVLVRRVDVPTRARLDWAAWWDVHFREDTARCTPAPSTRVTLDSLRFDGLFDTWKTSFKKTPLTAAERIEPMAWEPVRSQLLSWNFDSASRLVEAMGSVSSWTWGDTSQCARHAQVVAVWIHRTPQGPELWAEVEFSTSMAKSLVGIKDDDGDGHAEVFARVAPGLFTPSMLRFLESDYLTRRLTRSQAMDWVNQMAGDGYLQYNTDVLPPSSDGIFPTAALRPEISKEWKDSVRDPLCVIRGRPFGVPLYLVIVVDSLNPVSRNATAGAGPAGGGAPDSSATRRVDSLKSALSSAPDGPDHRVVAACARLDSRADAASQALEASGGWLLFRRELEYLRARDGLAGSPNDPVEQIVAFRDSLAKLGIDFLFVPIPTKQDVVPEILNRGNAKSWAQPAVLHLCARLAQRNVETIDLLPAPRTRAGGKLWRKQDTHWTPSGLDAVASELAARIRGYGWFGTLSPAPATCELRDTVWNDPGDLVGKLPVSRRLAYRPEALSGARVFCGGAPNRDVADAPILVLGDSYTGVYHLVPPKAAGITDLLAYHIGHPIDLTMGWGGGPEARTKLALRGKSGLQGKRLVVWMMSARDIFAYPGGWPKR